MAIDFDLPTPQEAVDVSVNIILSEIVLAIESADLKCSRSISLLSHTYPNDVWRMAAIMFAAGKITGVRQERSKRRNYRDHSQACEKIVRIANLMNEEQLKRLYLTALYML